MNRPKYKAPPPSEVLSSLLAEQGVEPAPDEFSFERGLLDDILGTGSRVGKGGGGLRLNSSNNGLGWNHCGSGNGNPRPKIYSGRDNLGADKNGRPGSGRPPRRSPRRGDHGSSSSSSLSSAEEGITTTGTETTPRDLVASMAARLNVLEKDSRALRKELLEKDKEMQRLRRQNDLLERTVNGDELDSDRPSQSFFNGGGSNPNVGSQYVPLAAPLDCRRGVESSDKSAVDGRARRAIEAAEQLQEENEFLKQQIHEMESFLSDYGLVWVGSQPTPEQRQQQQQQADPHFLVSPEKMAPSGDGTSGTGSKSPSTKAGATTTEVTSDVPVPHFDLLFAKIKELNNPIAEAGPRLVKEGKRASYKYDADSIRITVFLDGIIVRGGGFRSYAETSAQVFVRDIIDGYFPSEFKDQYPTGVQLVVLDRRHDRHGDGEFKAFGGSGNTLGRKVRTLAQIGGGSFGLTDGPPVDADELLRRLPERVVKNGRVIDIRAGIKQRIDSASREAPTEAFLSASPRNSSRHASCGGVDIVQTVALERMQTAERGIGEGNVNTSEEEVKSVDILPQPKISDETSSTVSSTEVTTLRVRLPESGTRPLLLKMTFDETVGELHAAVSRHLNINEDDFELRTSFPNRSYDNKGETLRAAGLTPNAALILRRLV